MSTTKLFNVSLLGLVLLKLLLQNRVYIQEFFASYSGALFLSLFINVIVYRYYVKLRVLNHLYGITIQLVEDYIANLYYILLVGSIGSRKSANLTALTQMCEMSKIKRMHNYQDKCRLLLKNCVNFAELDDYIQKNYDCDRVYHDHSYLSFVYYYFKKHSKILHLSKKVLFESFSEESVLRLLAHYVEVYYYLNFRSSHILSNTAIESINTMTNSLPVTESFFQIYRKNDLAHEKYLVIVEDEKGVVDNARVYARMDKESVKNNDDGKDINAMLQRHGSKGTNTTLVVSQSEKDVTANRRRLPNRFIEFLKPRNAYIYSLEITFLDSLLTLVQKRNSLRTDKLKVFLSKKTKKRQKNGLKPKRLNKLYHKLIKLEYNLNFSGKIAKHLTTLSIRLKKHLFLIRPLYLHEKEEDLGSEVTSLKKTVIKTSFKFTFVYPADITFGRYDQFAYYDVYNQRNKKASLPLSKVAPFNKKVMSKEEHLRMNYASINRIYEKINTKSDNTKGPIDIDKTVSYDSY